MKGKPDQRERIEQRQMQDFQSRVDAHRKPKPLVSLLDFADKNTSARAARERLKQLRNDLSEVLRIPGAGLSGNANNREAKRIVAEIAECRKILDNTGVN